MCACVRAFGCGRVLCGSQLHTGVRPFHCKRCSYATHISSNLAKHERTHAGAGLFQCPRPGCGFASLLTKDMLAHEREHVEAAQVQLGTVTMQTAMTMALPSDDRWDYAGSSRPAGTCPCRCGKGNDVLVTRVFLSPAGFHCRKDHGAPSSLHPPTRQRYGPPFPDESTPTPTPWMVRSTVGS